MAAVRVFDLFNAFIGSTQLAGGETLSLTHGFRRVAANNDGFAAEAARDKTRFFCRASIAGEDPANFDAILAAFEAVSAGQGLTVKGDAKTVGVTGTPDAYRITLNRMKLVSASLSMGNGLDGGYCKTSFNLANSAAAASSAQSDEVAITNVTKTITHSTALRGVRCKTAAFDPDGAGASYGIPGFEGIELSVQGSEQVAAGDDDFGETVEVAGYVVGGRITFRDMALTGGLTVSQTLMADTLGVLTVGYATQARGTAGSIVLANLEFEEDVTNLRARQMGLTQLSFGQFSMNGSNAYTLATGSNKLITIG